MSPEIGRRERKKAQTRKAIGDAALELFLARGYEQVGVREIADAADVSVTTLFNYFPTKEALAFDDSEDVEAELLAAVRERAPGQSIPQALRGYLVRWVSEVAAYPHAADFGRMIEQTPALQAYARRIWLRYESVLARAIADETGAGDVACATLARFALEAFELAHRHPDPVAATDTIFALLDHGWTDVEA